MQSFRPSQASQNQGNSMVAFKFEVRHNRVKECLTPRSSGPKPARCAVLVR